MTTGDARRPRGTVLLASALLVALILCLAPAAPALAQDGGDTPAAGDERPSTLAALEDEYVALARDLRPSVVRVVSRRTVGLFQVRPDPDDGPAEPRTLTVPFQCSGVIVRDDGLVVTIEAAVRDADEVQVELYDGRVLVADPVGVDDVTGLAVLRVRGGGNLPAPADFSRTTDPEPGRLTVALGHPYGLGPGFTTGVVSGVERDPPDRSPAQGGLLQVTAPVNPGDAGGLAAGIDGRAHGIVLGSWMDRAPVAMAHAVGPGPADMGPMVEILAQLARAEAAGDQADEELLRDLRERLERLRRGMDLDDGAPEDDGGRNFDVEIRRIGGTTVSQGGAEGIHFVMPAPTVRRVVDDLARDGRVHWGYLGVVIGGEDLELRRSLGVPGALRMEQVVPGGPAAESGLRTGGVLLELGGVPAQRRGPIVRRVLHARPGETLDVRWIPPGAGAPVDARVTIGDRADRPRWTPPDPDQEEEDR